MKTLNQLTLDTNKALLNIRPNLTKPQTQSSYAEFISNISNHFGVDPSTLPDYSAYLVQFKPEMEKQLTRKECEDNLRACGIDPTVARGWITPEKRSRLGFSAAFSKSFKHGVKDDE
jgi:hypothetical protein